MALPYSRSPKISLTPTGAKEFQIGLCGVVETELQLFCNSWSEGFLGERLYVNSCYQLNVLVPSSRFLAT